MTIAHAHILVIDDNLSRLEVLVSPFAGWDWHAVIAPAGPQLALAQMAGYAFDLVLLDLEAAELNNYAFLRQVAENEELRLIPVVITAGRETDQGRIANCLKLGADDFLLLPAAPLLLRTRMQNAIQEKRWRDQARTALEAFNEIERVADDLRLVILPIGAALSVETDEDRLLERIVREARRICSADAGTLYLARDEVLDYVFTRIGSLDVTFGGVTGRPVPYPPLPLRDMETGEPNEENVATYVALAGESVNIANVYDAWGFDFSGMKAFDEQNNYRTLSCLTVPLRNGQIVGALQLLNAQDQRTGEIIPFDVYHQQVAESLASQAAIVLNNRALQARQAMLMGYKRELEIGREIQAGFFPDSLPQPAGWEVAARFRPAREVAGDFYDAFELPNGRIALVIADICDKGIVAALFMALIRSLLRAFLQQRYHQEPFSTHAPLATPHSPLATHHSPLVFSPADREALLEAVDQTNSYLTANHGQSYMFATLFCGLLDPATGELLYLNCGHTPPLVLSAAGESGGKGRWRVREILHSGGPAVGLVPTAHYHVAETTLLPGDLLFAFTDGIIEARNAQGEQFGNGRLLGLLQSVGDEELPEPVETTATGLLRLVEAAVVRHTAGAEAFDDLTMLVLRRLT
jgi:sigma-B regulation protein RsbU (phosphoserine phosphatase)